MINRETMIVNAIFDVDRLPPGLEHLECYTLIGDSPVLIEGKGKLPATVFLKKDTRQMICSCWQAQLTGECDHMLALLNGLWARLAALPRNTSLLTRTQDWCTWPPGRAPEPARAEAIS